MKRVIIVHGWDGYPEEGWFPWLKKELVAKGLQVLVPAMPTPSNPKIEEWVPKLVETVGEADGDTYFVGHSMGCKTIVKYLEGLSADAKIGAAVFVAGWLKRLTNLEDDEVKEMAKHWLETPIDFVKVQTHLKNSVAIFSDDDPYVPLDNKEDFKDKLGSKIIVQQGMGHFSGSTGTMELPVVLEELLKMTDGY